MCTWAVMETVGYFLRNGSEVFSCQTDMTKAFDFVRHSLLFIKLLKANLSKIFIRLLIIIYKFQFANVRWNGFLSSVFSLCNGVRQGQILSGILYCFYVNNLFILLRRRTTGCWVNNNYHGMFGYSDDNWVLAPSLTCLQEMMVTIEEYCQEHRLQFSTDPIASKCKTKCIAFLQKERPLKNIILNGNPLPWVKEGVHLGNYFENKYNGMCRDIQIKRAQFINKSCELLQEFSFAHPCTILKMHCIYNLHFTGSPLWNIFGPDIVRLENSWNVCVRKIFGLPFNSHRYFIEPLSKMKHQKNILTKRFISFLGEIQSSKKNIPKQLLNVIKNDTRSTTGNNLRNILLLCEKSQLEEIDFDSINQIRYHPIDEENEWKLNIIEELINSKYCLLTIPGFSVEECEDLIVSISTS